MEQQHFSPHDTLLWEAFEYNYVPKNADWYWGVAFVTLILVGASIAFNNILLAGVLAVGAVVFILNAIKKPRYMKFSLTPRGVAIGNEFHPYSALRSFYIEESEDSSKLIIQPQKKLSLYLIIPLEPALEYEAKLYLLRFIPEEEHHEPLMYKIMERFGF